MKALKSITQKVEMFPLLLVIFIDSMGLGLVFPILNALLVDKHNGFIQGAWAQLSGNIIFGIFIGVFMLCWFLGAALLGDLSDQIGRKRSLMICLIGAFIGYLLSALAIVLHSMSLLLIGRVIAGLTSGSQPIAQAAIVDMSTYENKAQNISLMLMVLSLGFIVGPMIGGLFSDSSIVSWFNLATPLYITAAISLLNVILLKKLFKETFIAKNKVNLKLHAAVTIFTSAFKHPKVRKLSIIFFVFIMGWSSFYSFISMFLTEALQYNNKEVSYFMAIMGFGFVLGNSFGVNFAIKRFSLKTSSLVSIMLSALVVVVMLYVTGFSLWILMIVLAALVAVAYACMITLFSNQVDANSQGWVMGVTGSIMAFVWGIDAFLLGGIASWGVQLPLIISAVSLLLSGLLLFNFKSEEASSQEVSPIL